MDSGKLDHDQILRNISEFEQHGRSAQGEPMQVDSISDETFDFAIDALLEKYEALVNSQRQTLQQLQSRTVPLTMITSPSIKPQERLRQLQIVDQAYRTLVASTLDLPDSHSLVPVFLAARELNQSITDGQGAMNTVLDQLASAEHQALSEEASLSDARQLSNALQQRDSSLRQVEREQAAQAPEAASRKLLDAKADRKTSFQAEYQGLSEALSTFIDSHLGALLAAEELGGPVVGDLQDVGDDMLIAGFSSQGKPKSSSSKPMSQNQRQRRIDEIWSATTTMERSGSEHEVAALEAKQLIDDLLDFSRRNAGSYYDLKRESAVARFLVRAKVAQYHPKDARKLRLLDFGRELVD